MTDRVITFDEWKDLALECSDCTAYDKCPDLCGVKDSDRKYQALPKLSDLIRDEVVRELEAILQKTEFMEEAYTHIQTRINELKEEKK